MTNYAGVNLIVGGNVTRTLSACAKVSDNLPAFLDGLATNPGVRNILVMYNDPCNEITNPLNCSGPLAIGGSFFSSSTNIHDAQTWYTSIYGFSVVNDGWGGTCQSFFCASGTYETFMTHELSHCLSIDHIAGSNTANMNPSCCTSISALDIACLNYTYPVALPVELTSFSGKSLNNGNQLKWETASESKNHGFHIERSKDGINFEEISFIKGKKSEDFTKNYTFLDQHPFPNLTYYRLVQEDFDGKKENSPIISIQNEENALVSIAPNPIENDQFNLSLYSNDADDYAFELINLQGQKLQYWHKLTEKGFNSFDFNLDNIPKGCYFLKVSDALGLVKVKKLIIE
jgi:Secretion system C-terminal sorting domain